LYTSAYHLILGYTVTEGAGFVFWLIAARIYSTTEMGLAAGAITATMFVATFSTLGFAHSLIRFLPNSSQVSVLINSSIALVALVAVAGAVIFLVGSSVWAPQLVVVRQNGLLAFLFVIFALTSAVRPLLFSIFVAARRARFVTILASCDSFLKLTFVMVFAATLAGVLRTFAAYFAWGIAVAAPVFLGVLLLIRLAYKSYRPGLSLAPAPISQMFRFSLASYVSELSWFSPASGLIGWIMVLVVGNLLGVEQTAYFYIVWLIVAFLNVIPVSISSSLLAEGSYNEETVYVSARRSLRLAILVLVPIIIVVLIVGNRFLLLFGDAYAVGGSTLLKVLALSSLPLAYNSVSLGIWRVQRKLRPIVALGLVIALTSVVLTYTLSPRLGILSPGIAWLIAQSLGALLVGRTSWRRIASA